MKTVPMVLGLVVGMFALFQVRAQPSAPAVATKVCMAATGPSDHLPGIMDILADHLADKQVKVKQLGAEPKSRGVALDEMASKSGQYLLYVTLEFAPRLDIHGSITAQCFEAGGKLLWEEKSNGSMVMFDQSSYIKGMANKLSKKLDSHVGKEGLPKE
jgi:hypothetical protein